MRKKKPISGKRAKTIEKTTALERVTLYKKTKREKRVMHHENSIQKERAKKKKKAIKPERALAMEIINTYQGASKTIAMLGMPWAIPSVIEAIATGMKQIATQMEDDDF